MARSPLRRHHQTAPIKEAGNSHLTPNKRNRLNLIIVIFISSCCFLFSSHYSIAVAFVASAVTAGCAKRLLFDSGGFRFFSFFVFHQSTNKYRSATKSVFNEAGAWKAQDDAFDRVFVSRRGKQYFVLFTILQHTRTCSVGHEHRNERARTPHTRDWSGGVC